MTTLRAATILLFLGICINAVPQFDSTDLPHYTKLTEEEIRHLRNRGFGPTVPTVFATTSDDAEPEDTNVASSQQRSVTYAANTPAYVIQNAIPIREAKHPLREPVQVVRPRYQQPQQQQQQQQQYRLKQQPLAKEEEEEEEEIEEPDRLSLLLPQSKFTCTSKNTGYYADEDLNCEVFHYCQDNAKHSWICPEGFTFHQVHLICMPPSSENICAKSSQYHFVNEYLYKPINLEEYQQKPNVSLRYSERYYPDNYNYDNEEENESRHAAHHRTSIRVQDQPTPTFRPESNIGQVFRSPNEVNIPLHQRRPQYATPRYLKK